MNPDYKNQLEAAIDRELQGLGELPAPATLSSRIMYAIEQRAARPWYRRAWESWPMPLRAASLAGLLAAFGLVCFGTWQLGQSAAFATALREAGAWFSSLTVVWGALNALTNAVALAFKSLDPVVIIGGAAALFFCYAAGVGLGTACVRLAMARR